MSFLRQYRVMLHFSRKNWACLLLESVVRNSSNLAPIYERGSESYHGLMWLIWVAIVLQI